MYSQLKLFFTTVTCSKPKSSRNSSIEAFIVCQNYSPPEGYVPTMVSPMLDHHYGILFICLLMGAGDEMIGPNRVIVPFLACGDLSGYDADQTYPLQLNDEEYKHITPSQPPINPPYKQAMELKRNNFQALRISENQHSDKSNTTSTKRDKDPIDDND